MKIKRIEVKNFKAIKEQTANFDGHSAIITGGNDKGKSSLLKGIIDRFRGEKPDIILRDGQSKGYNIMELTDGARIEWKFTEKSETFAYITLDGFKQTTGVLKAIGQKYFGSRFDIDKFLNSQPKQQTKVLQELVGIDFSELDIRHDKAVEYRKDAKKELKFISAQQVVVPAQVEKPDIASLRSEIQFIKEKNTALYKEWQEANKTKWQSIDEYNRRQCAIADGIDRAVKQLKIVKEAKNTMFGDCVDMNEAQAIFDGLGKPKQKKKYEPLPEPDYYSLADAEMQLEKAYTQLSMYDNYIQKQKDYAEWTAKGKAAREKAKQAETAVKKIEAEREDMINNANIPSDFNFTADGVEYQGFPLQSSQISSSAKYIAALKLGSMVIGDIKTMHFDASFLDKNSLAKVQKWANANDYQLLIERPDFDGGEIKYEIV